MYRTTFSIDVLSEEPLGDCLSLSQVEYLITEGECVGAALVSKQTTLTNKEMAAALIAAGSTPDFFMLDEAGNKIDL